MKILSFGEIIWDVYPDKSAIGGAPLNFAGHCAAGGLESYLLSAVGRDVLGEEALQKLQDVEVQTDFVLQNDRPTGQCIVTLDARRVPSYRVLPDVAYDRIAGVDPDKINAVRFDAFYFGTLAQRCETSRTTLETVLSECTFKEIFCDLNLRDGCYDEKSVENCLKYATVLKFSEEELPRLDEFPLWQALGKEIFAALFDNYPQLKVILFTKGKDGADIYTKDGTVASVPAVGDKVVSTVGAGDSFGAAWLARYLAGDDVKRSAEIASRVSGYVVSVVEALPKYNISSFIS